MGRPKEDADEAALIAEERGENVVALPVKGDGKPRETVQQLNDAQREELLHQHQKSYNTSLLKKKKADADFKNVCKLAKSEIGATAVSDIKELNLLETQEGEEEVKAKIERTIWIAQVAGAKLGTQLRLFSDADGVPLGMKAYEAGRRAGLAGEKRKSPHAPGTEEDQQFLSGWSDGQSELAQKSFKRPTFREVAEEGDAVIHGEHLDAEPAYEVLPN